MISRSIISILVLLFGIFLSISSIIAIPIFEEETSTSSSELYFSLEKELSTVNISATDYIKNLSLDTSMLKDVEALNIKLANRSTLIQLKSQWKVQVADLIEKYTSEKNKIIIEFNGIGKIGFKIKSAYQQELILNYIDYCNSIKNKCYDKKNYLETGIARLIVLVRRSAADTSILSQYVNFLVGITSVDKEINSIAYQYPKKPIVGSELGFFNYLSGWLLQTESQSMAIITGLIGFGLFGAVISFFIKPANYDIGNNISEIIFDTFKLIAKGFSAAILVFLAAKGGISVISAGGNNSQPLNPYVIFFICLIASVYSDEIWKWAKTKLV